MNKAKQVARGVGAIALGALSTLVAWGASLALLWAIVPGDATSYKLVTLLLASGVGLVAGGYVSGRVADTRRVSFGLILGAVVGGCASLYLGPNLWVCLAFLMSPLLGALGGRLAAHRARRG